MKLIIDRKRWLRGDDRSYLKREDDGMMCCLGFCALALGATEEQITGKTTPTSTEEIVWPRGFLDGFGSTQYGAYTTCSPFTRQLIHVNDTLSTSDEFREARLIELFKQADIDVEFVD